MSWKKLDEISYLGFGRNAHIVQLKKCTGRGGKSDSSLEIV